MRGFLVDIFGFLTGFKVVDRSENFVLIKFPYWLPESVRDRLVGQIAGKAKVRVAYDRRHRLARFEKAV